MRAVASVDVQPATVPLAGGRQLVWQCNTEDELRNIQLKLMGRRLTMFTSDQRNYVSAQMI